MTVALKAMVEAMAAEIERQREGDHFVRRADGVSVSLDGEVDLEKVARAGLEAIRRPDLRLRMSTVERMSDSLNEVWPMVIDEILKETP